VADAVIWGPYGRVLDIVCAEWDFDIPMNILQQVLGSATCHPILIIFFLHHLSFIHFILSFTPNHSGRTHPSLLLFEQGDKTFEKTWSSYREMITGDPRGRMNVSTILFLVFVYASEFSQFYIHFWMHLGCEFLRWNIRHIHSTSGVTTAPPVMISLKANGFIMSHRRLVDPFHV